MKDDKPGDREPKRERRTPAASGSVSVPVPPRPASVNLFELDTPSSASGTHALGLPPLTAAEIKFESPANDVVDEPVVNEPVVPSKPPGPRMNSDLAKQSAEIDAEFAALAHTNELEAPVIAAQLSATKASEPERFQTRQMTHVASSENFDATLKLPRAKDTLEARRSRLEIRYKSACSAYKMLSGFEINASARKEIVDLIAAYEAQVRAALPPPESGEKHDPENYHDLLPATGFDEHERALTRIEDRLLALDDTITEDEFRASVSREKHPAKALLRYARVLGMRRFNVGYRRDRFEYLATELLANQAADKRLQLLPRDQAGPVLFHLLAGLPQIAATEEREPAVQHLREALDRLSEIEGPKEFFESEFFLDLHGYKISMRDQITCPEFLYLCTAIQVELHNRMLAWSRASAPAAGPLRSQLQAQQRAAEDVFTNFRRPRSTPAGKSSPRPAPAKEALPQPVPPRRKRRKSRAAAEDDDTLDVTSWLKLAGLALVIVLCGGWLCYDLGVFEVGTPPKSLGSSELQDLSPLLIRATYVPRTHQLEALIERPDWRRMSKQQRRAFAAELVAKLKQKNIPNAQIVAYKSPVIRIEFSTVVFLDEST